EVLENAGAHYLTRYVGYDETVDPATAESRPLSLVGHADGAPGVMSIGHPAACTALAHAAAGAGAEVRFGGTDVEIGRRPGPSVRYVLGGRAHVARCGLIVGADGRQSMVRRQAHVQLLGTPPQLFGAGLLVEDVGTWPHEQMSVGTEGDRIYYIVPQG